MLRSMQSLCDHPLLKGSVTDETQHRLILSNGSEIRSVPASDRQIRGWSVDLLLIDEAAFLSEDLILSAALPTTSARPDAKIVLASSPWGDTGAFRTLAEVGQDPRNPHTVTFQWQTRDAWWISEATIEAARASMSDLRFRAEYLGEWVPAGDAFFNIDDVRDAVADFPLDADGGGGQGFCGLDWGRRRDAHAVAIAAVLGDFGANGRAIVFVPWVETSRRPYARQVEEVVRLAGMWDLTIVSETNGVGAMPTETLAQRLPYIHVHGVSSSQSSKENAYGRVSALLSEQRLVLPQHAELLRQLAGVTATPTPSGGLRIAARSEGIHDDVPDALSLAVAALPLQLADPPRRDAPEGTVWVENAAGVRVPVPARTSIAQLDWSGVYGPGAEAAAEGGESVGDEPPNPWLAVYGGQGVDTAQRLAGLRSLPLQRAGLGAVGGR